MKAVSVIHLLGYAGLIPFVAAALLVAAGSAYSAASLAMAGAYAFGIISFLTGSWWGMALSPGSRGLLVASNLFFLAAFFVFALLPQWWPLTAALILTALALTERSGLFPALPDHYRQLRTSLTLIAGAAMLTLQLMA